MSHEFKRVKGHFHLGDKGLSAEGLRHRDRLDRMAGLMITDPNRGWDNLSPRQVVEQADKLLAEIDEYLKL